MYMDPGRGLGNYGDSLYIVKMVESKVMHVIEYKNLRAYFSQ